MLLRVYAELRVLVDVRLYVLILLRANDEDLPRVYELLRDLVDVRAYALYLF